MIKIIFDYKTKFSVFFLAMLYSFSFLFLSSCTSKQGTGPLILDSMLSSVLKVLFFMELYLKCLALQ